MNSHKGVIEGPDDTFCFSGRNAELSSCPGLKAIDVRDDPAVKTGPVEEAKLPELNSQYLAGGSQASRYGA